MTRNSRDPFCCFTALESLRESEDENVRSAVSGALWQLEGKERHVKVLNSSPYETGKQPFRI